MGIAFVTISIFAIALAAWLLGRLSRFKICPICAGVSGTWLWLLFARGLSYEVNPVVLAMLLGGSVVGIAYKLEKKLPAGRSDLLWKLIFIPLGFLVAYSLVMNWRVVFWIELALLLLFVLLFLKLLFRHHKDPNKMVAARPMGREELKQKMKKCC